MECCNILIWSCLTIPGIVEQGLSLGWLGCTLVGPTYESNIPYALRYMIDSSIVGGSWVELPADKYTLVPPAAQQSHCQLEAHVNFSSVISHPCEGEWSRLAPFRILSVDIECQGRKVSLYVAGSTLIGARLFYTKDFFCRVTFLKPSMIL